jgi:hypothetical protein
LSIAKRSLAHPRPVDTRAWEPMLELPQFERERAQFEIDSRHTE